MSGNAEVEICRGKHHSNSHEDEPPELVNSQDEDEDIPIVLSWREQKASTEAAQKIFKAQQKSISQQEELDHDEDGVIPIIRRGCEQMRANAKDKIFKAHQEAINKKRWIGPKVTT